MSDNILEIIVDGNHQLTFSSPDGAVDSGVLMDINQVISQMLRDAPVMLPNNDDRMQPVKEIIA